MAQPPTEPMVAAKEKKLVATKFLAEILDSHEDAEAGARVIELDGMEEDTQEVDVPPPEGYCIECEGASTFNRPSQRALAPTIRVDQPAEGVCESCGDSFCEVCFASAHRKGSRRALSLLEHLYFIRFY